MTIMALIESPFRRRADKRAL